MWAALFLLSTGTLWRIRGQGVPEGFPQGDQHPECHADLAKIADGLARKQTWAFKILDSWTKIPSGVLTGHFVDYGNYDECLNSGGDFPMQHCFASIRPPAGFAGLAGNDSSLTPSLILRWSYCLPASCPPVVLENILRDVIQGFPFNVSVTESDCTSKESRTISAGDIVGISIWGAFFGLAVISTIYDVLVERFEGRKSKPKWEFPGSWICANNLLMMSLYKWLASFSIYTNGMNLLKMDAPPEAMLPLYGLRFLSICWVVLGHRYFFTATSSLLNLTDFAEELKKLHSQFFIQGVLSVDTFFFLSGFLNCYHLLTVLEKLNRFPIVMYYVHRYIRLTPVLAAVVLMYATWYSLIGDGPVWAQTTAVWKQLCVDNWLPTLLYVNNYYNPISQCAGQSWYLAVDMQLYWLSPLVVIPLWKRPKIGRYLLGGLLLASTIVPFLVAYFYEFRMSFTFGLSVEELQRVTKLIYVPTHTRATPYIMGVIIGDYVHTLKKEKTRLVFSKGVLWLGWLLSTLVGLSVVLGNFQFSRPVADHPYNKWESSSYIALHRLAWGVVLGWIVVACLNKHGGIVNTILSLKIFIPLSRLTYCIFLSHMAIQQYNLGTARTSNYFQYFNQIHSFFGDLMFSVLAATCLTLVFESPILVLEKLSGGKPRERNLKSEVNNGFQDDSTDKTHEI